ncbi:PTS sugar transporter subunit IIB [Amnibacterium kyonggiense]|uniref:PTS system IIB component (L-Asc family) n=1 Tax=Amnibacterium kyonggiense TaxID=595671 RepID=A0A4R7FFM8_9MICO|nr:PTS sugar transporter subunit IIB [Amnibacterium kyonggiense]TDS75011.1 PTS system IIB component (L-Asc family) [Amnibacterium kyonggiense]
MAVQILTVCGAGVGTSEILRVTATRALQRLGIEATVTATDAEHVRELAEEAQVVLATSEKVAAIGRTYAQVIVIDNILDQAEVEAKLADALD